MLLTKRKTWVRISISIARSEDGVHCIVKSIHSLRGLNTIHNFVFEAIAGRGPNTEYGNGVSVIHDVKDHYFYGLNITVLTEFQTIVQTYFGRECSTGTAGKATSGDYESRIEMAIHDELFGPRGPRVYDPAQQGLLPTFCAFLGDTDQRFAFRCMRDVCLDIMLPRLRKVYLQRPLVAQLQASTRDQPDLVDHFLPGLDWHSTSDRLFRLGDNDSYSVQHDAFVDDELEAISRDICTDVSELRAIKDLDRFGPIFDVKGYLVTDI